MKLIHSEKAKLERSSFTGTCYTLGNPQAASVNVKAHYSKTQHAFTLYWHAVLHSSWLTMVESHQGTVLEALSNAPLNEAVEKFRYVGTEGL